MNKLDERKIVDGFLREIGVQQLAQQTSVRAVESVLRRRLVDLETLDHSEAMPFSEPAEKALLASIMGRQNAELLAKLDEKDFWNPGSALVFRELRLMVEAGEPMGDAVATPAWFRTPQARARALEAGEEDLAFVLAETLTDPAGPPGLARCSTYAHDEYLLGVLRKLRVRRSMNLFAYEMLKVNKTEELDPMKTLSWARSTFDALWEKIAEVFPDYE